MLKLRRALRYGMYGIVTATALRTGQILIENDYDISSLALVRLSRTGLTVMGIARSYKRQVYGNECLLDRLSEEYSQLRSQVHTEAAQKLLQLCRENRGVYIKVGQHIGALEFLVPKEYIETMKVLHSNAPCSSLEDVYKVLREEFKKDPMEIFSKIEPEPQGTASLAQVHKAWLKDGRVVALKVQHPYVRNNAGIDLKTMEFCSNFVSWIFPDYKLQWLVDESKKNIPLELDFMKEAENTEKVRKMFRHFPWLKIPIIHLDLCTNRVLTMEFIEGGQVNDLDYIQSNNINAVEVSDKLGHLYSCMIFNEGFVHSDPHPGNILVRKSKTGAADIILIDHGLYATLSDDVRWAYSKLWLGILNRDEGAMKDNCTKLGVGDLYALFACMVCGRTWDSIQSGINTTKYSIQEKERFQKEIPNFVSHILNALASVNYQMLLILKTNDLLRGIEHTLRTHARNVSFLVMSRCCIKSVYGEKILLTDGRFARFYLKLEEQWILFKLKVYYTYLSISSSLPKLL